MSQIDVITLPEEKALIRIEEKRNLGHQVLEWNDFYHLHYCYLCLSSEGSTVLIRYPVVTTYKEEIPAGRKELDSPEPEVADWEMKDKLLKAADNFEGPGDDLIDELEKAADKLKISKMKTYLGLKKISIETVKLQEYSDVLKKNNIFCLIDISDSLSGRMGFINIDQAKAFIVDKDDIIDLGIALSDHRKVLEDSEED